MDEEETLDLPNMEEASIYYTIRNSDISHVKNSSKLMLMHKQDYMKL
jgi:hypothetical protein